MQKIKLLKNILLFVTLINCNYATALKFDYHTLMVTDNSILISSIYNQNKEGDSSLKNMISIDYSRKLVIGETKKPMVYQKIVLKDPSTNKTVTAITDEYGVFTLMNLNLKTCYEIEIPVDTLSLIVPRKMDNTKNSFKVDFKESEFPELARYKNVAFEVGDENINFDKSYLTTKWDSITLLKGTNTGCDYKIILEKKEEKTELIAYPVFAGTDLEIALKEYQNKIISYKLLSKGEKLYMAKIDGTIVKKFHKEGNSFIYELLPSEFISFSKEKEADPELASGNFIGSFKLKTQKPIVLNNEKVPMNLQHKKKESGQTFFNALENRRKRKFSKRKI